MSTHTDSTEDRQERERGTERDDETGAPGRAKRVASSGAGRGWIDRVATLAGTALLARAIQATVRGERRAAGRALAAAAVLGLGVRRRRSGDSSSGAESEAGAAESDGEGDKEVSDEARAAVERTDVLGQAETNPRGTSEEPDVEAADDEDEGEIQFTDEQEADAETEPHLDEEVEQDPRNDESEEEVDIDLSEAAMADEASEATGPTDDQAQPTKTEGTEPELSDPEDASHMQADVPDGTDADDGGTAGGGSDDETNEDQQDDEDERA